MTAVVSRKIGVVGGTGNISFAFVSRMVSDGHEVHCINRGQSGPQLPGTKHIACDRADRERFEGLVSEQGFDTVIDMMSFTADDAQSAMRASAGVSHFIQCSTVCAYGVEYDEMPVTEDHPLRPITDYGRNKAAADELLLTAWRENGFPVTIIRPSTTYGPKLGLARQLGRDYSWIDRIRAGKPIAQLDDGSCRHQFLHVDDAAQCFVGLLGRTDLAGEVINLVRDESDDWNFYHRCAMEAIGVEAELVGVAFEQARAANIPNFALCEDIFRYQSWFSGAKLMQVMPEFKPQVSLVEGMRETIAAMDADKRLPVADAGDWEDKLISVASQ